MTLPALVQHITRYWWVIAVTVVTTTIVLLGAALRAPAVYVSTSTVFVPGPVDGDGVFRDFDRDYSERATRTYLALASTAPVREQLRTELGLAELPEIELEQVPVTDLVSIRVEADDPVVAERTADGMATVFVEKRWERSERTSTPGAADELRTRLDELQDERTRLAARVRPGDDIPFELESLNARIVNLQSRIDDFETADSLLENSITLVEPASSATEERSSIPLALFLGVGLGTLAGLLLSLVLPRFRPEALTSEEIQELSRFPVLFELDDDRNGHAGIDAARKLADGHFGQANGTTPQGRVLLVTTPTETRDPSGLATRLTDVYRQLGYRVLHLDRSDTNHPLLGVAGDTDAEPLPQLIRAYRDQYDFIVVDAPDYLGSDIAPLYRLVADQTVMVVEPGGTTRSDLLKIERELSASDGQPAGLALAHSA